MQQLGGVSLFGWLALVLVLCLLAGVKVNGDTILSRVTRVFRAGVAGSA